MEDRLKEIEALGSALMEPDEAAVIMQEPELVSKLNKKQGPEHKAYARGQLKTVFEVRKNMIEMAKNGSSPAQKAVMDLLKDYAYKQAQKK